MQQTRYKAVVAVLLPDRTWYEHPIEGDLLLAEWDGDPDGISAGEVYEQVANDAPAVIAPTGGVSGFCVLSYSVADGAGLFDDEGPFDEPQA